MTMTTVGYGDIFPHSSEEKLYTILAMIVSCGVFAYIMGSIGSFVEREDERV
jgi:hyperpolarization activated cyclic nucleotide-gated potassium channel 2